VVSVGACGVIGCGGRWQSSEMGVDKRSIVLIGAVVMIKLIGNNIKYEIK